MSFVCLVSRMSFVCTRMSSACHSCVLVCHPYVTRLACTRMSSVCRSYILVCHPYVTRVYLYVIRISLVCGFTMNLQHTVKYEIHRRALYLCQARFSQVQIQVLTALFNLFSVHATSNAKKQRAS